MIRYKVIGYNRKSVIINYWNIDKYSITYKKDKIIEAKNTLGIFCFDTLENAKDFSQMINSYTNSLIIKVDTIGEEYIPNKIVCSVSEKNLNMFYKSKNVIRKNPPTGTICCKKVKVLE